MTRWLTSDTHFNHRGILKFCPDTRPWSDHREMNAGIVEIWNDRISPKDEVFILGDFGFKTSDGDDLEVIFKSLKGRKHLVIGNHDEQNPTVLKLPWESTSDLLTLRDQTGDKSKRAIACHYPLLTWKHAHRGHLMLHGHSHGTLKDDNPRRFDVGWDVWGAPKEWDFFFEQAGEFVPVDHHGADL